MIRCPNCNQSFHAYMRGGAFIAVSLDGSRLLVDTNADMRNTDFLNPNALGSDSTLICPQCGEVAGAHEWKEAWKRFSSLFNKDLCRCGGKFGSNGKSNICLSCNHRGGDAFIKYPEIKLDYAKLRGYVRKNYSESEEKIQAFGWCDY